MAACSYPGEPPPIQACVEEGDCHYSGASEQRLESKDVAVYSETSGDSGEKAMKLSYVVVFERSPNNYSAYAPDVPGCVSVGDTWEEMQAMIKEALEFHIESMVEDGEAIPEPRMSLEEAMAYHSQPLTDEEKASLAEFGDETPTLSTTFEPVEIEVRLPQPAASGP